MQPNLVLGQLLDLPPTFTSPGALFSWIYNSLAAAESLYTGASDGSAQVLSAPTALGPWLTAWGEILGISRLPGESDLFFSIRLRNTLISPVGTKSAIQAWSQYYLGSSLVSVTENVSGPGYIILIPAGIPIQVIENWLSTLGRVRPAGVPFVVESVTSPLMLGTYSYIGADGFAGSYLGYGSTPYQIAPSANTNSAIPLIATILLTDPNLNGKLQLGLAA